MPFDLTSEPWLPCRAPNGARATLGIRELFERAHELECLDDPSPLVTLALLRLLLAILHRVVGPGSLSAWKALYAAGRFPMDRLAPYLDEQREAFDLLHHSRPFYQTRGLPKEYEADGVDRLILERSSYGAPSLLFQHRPIGSAARDTLSFADAARNLVALHAFDPPGLIKKRGEPDAGSAGLMNRGAYVIVRGSSLFETLVLNLVVYDPENNKPFAGDAAKDRPSWEQPPMGRPTGSREPKRLAYGYIDWLTWQSRRVELSLSPDRTAVEGVVRCIGHGVESPLPQDPMLAFRLDKDAGALAIGFSETRVLWRDCHVFVRAVGRDGASPPAAVAQLATRELGVLTKATTSLLVLGMRGKEKRIKFSRAERLVIPSQIVADSDLQSRVADASVTIEGIATKLRGALRLAAAKTLAAGERQPDPSDVVRLVATMGDERRYWAALATPFALFLEELPRAPDKASENFQATARISARDALRSACVALGSEARHLKALACAESYLARELSTTVPPGVPS